MPIIEELRNVLIELMEFTDNEYLFQDFNGGFLEISNMSAKISNIFRDTTYHFNLYNLRHQFATDLVEEKTDVRTV